MYENSVSMYVLILSTVHQIDAPKINFFTQSRKKIIGRKLYLR